MSRILGKLLTIELAAIPAVNKKPGRVVKCSQTTGEAARFTPQSSEVMAEFGIVPLNGVGLAFVRHGLMKAGVVQQAITVPALFRFRGVFLPADHTPVPLAICFGQSGFILFFCALAVWTLFHPPILS
jgi:hypothetical protein